MKNSVAKTLLVFLFLVLSHRQALAIRTYSIASDEVKAITTLIDKDSLVLIDIDNTLITPKSRMLAYSSAQSNFINNLILQAEKRPFLKTAVTAWLQQRKVMLVELEWSNYIEQLKQQGAMVLGVTSMSHLIYETFKNPELWRYNEISQLGVQFADKVNGKEQINIYKLRSKDSIFYKGIIFTGPYHGQSKTLVEFMRITNLSPNKIVMFSNSASKLASMADAVKTFMLTFHKINYLAVQRLPSAIDNRIIKLQQSTLINTGKWLEDEEAMKELQNETN